METLIKEIEQRFDLDVQQIKEETALKVRQINQKTQDEINAYKEEVEKKAQEQLDIERRKVVGKLERYLKNQENHYKCALISDAKKGILDKIEILRKEQPEVYKKILESLIIQTLKEVKGKILVRANKEDKLLCRKYLQSKNMSFQIIEDNNIAMGLVAYNEEDKVIVYNTLESRWKKMFSLIKKLVGECWQEEGSNE
ncbi:MAG: V-type ATP synthase subunit E family protein [bacterium]|nr:V-type ATP synthase subunit E family protein [bacterium]